MMISANALLFLSFQITTVGVPAYLARLGSPDRIISLATALSAASALVARPFAARISESRSVRSSIIFGSAMIGIPAIFCIFQPNSSITILAARVVQGFGWGISAAACGVAIADSARANHLSEGIGYAGSVSSAATACASPLAIFIMKQTNGSILMLLIAVFSFSTLLLTSFFLRNNAEKKPKRHNRFSWSLYLEKNAVFPAYLICFITICYAPVATFVPSYMQEAGSTSGLYFLCYAAATIVIRPLMGMYADRKGWFFPVSAAMLSGFAALLLLRIGHNTAAFCLSAVFSGISTGAGINTIQTMAAVCAAPKRRSAAIAVFFIGFDLGMIFGSMLSGMLSEMLGYRRMFGAMSLIPIIGFVLFIFKGRRYGNKIKSPE